MKFRLTSIKTIIVCFVLCSIALGQDLASFEKRTTVKKLANGLTIIICERPEAPVFSFFTHVDAGSVQDPMGKTGLAHMFEHMAFKGTDTIGTRNWSEEKKALDAIEQVYDRLDAERRKGLRADKRRVEAIEAELKEAIGKADSFVEPSEFDRIVEGNGGVGLNASTGEDSTNYFY